MNKEILVLGATGKTGRKVVKDLEQIGYPVRKGSRSENLSFDWHNPENWPEILQGIHSMYVTYQPDLAVPGASDAIRHLMDLAIKKNVKKVVILSGKGEVEAQKCEQIVVDSGLDYTLVRASWFMQNFSESFLLDPIIAGEIALPQATAKVPYVHTSDIAEVVVQSLIDDSHNGKTYELTGPQAMTFSEVIAKIASATSRDLQFIPISLQEYAQGMKAAGIPDDYAWLINYLFREVLGSKGSDLISTDIEKVLGKDPRSFDQYIEETLMQGVWQNPVSVM